ncbi:hypothetical protein E2C01_057703 [Portunus trituberculatus]|uniref:Uncharacterized protein n=1 Tax=Portunus trituberculatus TaxID=210409 RepID=A0A5B7H443_PORTR|nr:hypothetical protein [Portunus trituberculatus]
MEFWARRPLHKSQPVTASRAAVTARTSITSERNSSERSRCRGIVAGFGGWAARRPWVALP